MEIPDPDSGEEIIIQFGGGTDDTHVQSLYALYEAIREWGGQYGTTQWAAVQPVNAQIWNAAVRVWGNPTLPKMIKV